MEILNKELASIIARLDFFDNKDTYSKCLSFIDLTSLNSTDTNSKIESLVEKVNTYSKLYPQHPQVAAMCVYPNFAKVVKDKLTAQGIKIAVVAGVFPNSQSFLQVKCLESKIAVENGADEVDIVLSLSHFLQGDYESSRKEIREIKDAIGNAHLKVILETGALQTPELIEKASVLAMESGADFIKTSTGKMEPAATPMAALVMCKAIKSFYILTGKKIGFKPAGGIVTPKDAILYYAIVSTVLGEEWLNPQLFRLGASRLTNNLLSELENKPINFF